MSKIDFVPDDYLKQREMSRSNWIALGLLLAVLAGMGLTFSVLKIRRSRVNAELAAMDERLGKAHEQIKLLEKLERKGRAMMKTASVTAELPDLVGKSVILAGLTNNLPEGVSLTHIDIQDKEIKVQDKSAGQKTQFQKAKASKEIPVKIIKDTRISLSGTARNDIEVAGYIAALDKLFLVRSVGLIESRQVKIKDKKYRHFNLSVLLEKNIKVTEQGLASIRDKGRNIVKNLD